MKHKLIDDEAEGQSFEKWLRGPRSMPLRGLAHTYKAGWDDALKSAAELAYSVNNHDEHMQWVIPTGPNSDRCGWCACLETIAGLLDPDGYKGSETPGIHDNEKEEE